MVLLLNLLLLLLLLQKEKCSEYQLCHAGNTRTSSIKVVGVFFVSKLRFHNHVDFIFSECIKILGCIRSITFTSSSLDCLYVVYEYFTLVRSTLEHASLVWNSITSTDANKLERIQQKFASLCVYRFPPHVLYSYIFALEKLSPQSLRKRRHHIDVHFLFRSIMVINPALPSWKMLVFVFLLTMLGTSQRLVFVPLINIVLLLGASMPPT
jgi:hypothetical protein